MKNASIIPTLKYKDAPAAIEWLCKVLGFKKHLIVNGENETIAHAQLTFEKGMIMIGSADESDFGSLMKTPNELNNFNTQSAYIIVPEIETHYKNTKTNGAEIVMELADQDYGGQLYSCKDPEGNLWNFGSYNPWE